MGEFLAHGGAGDAQPAGGFGLVALSQLDGAGVELALHFLHHPGLQAGHLAALGAGQEFGEIARDGLIRGGDRLPHPGVGLLRVVQADGITAGEQERLPHRVLELAHVPGPSLGLEEPDGFGLERGGFDAQFRPGALHEILHQFRDVLRALAQGGKQDGDATQTVKEVLAKLPLLHGAFQVAMGGREHPDIDRDLLIAPDPLDILLLQDPQQLDLRAQAQVADFIQENGAPVGLLETAHPAGVGARVSAALVAEEFALEQRLRNGCAIHRDKRQAGALAVLVDGPRHQFLARAGLAPDKDGDGGGGDASDFLVNGLHGAAVADDGGLGRPGVAHLERLGHEPAAGHGLGDQIEEFAHVKGFEQVIVGAEFRGLDGGFGGAESGHHDDRELGLGGMELLDELESGQAGQLQIGEDHVARLIPGLAQAVIAAGRGRDLIALGPQLFFEGGHDAGIIFDNEDSGLGFHLSLGPREAVPR